MQSSGQVPTQGVSVKLSRAFLLLLGAVLVMAPAVHAQAAPAQGKKPECKVPEEAAKLANPVKAEAGSIREGRRMFETQCALCHGKAGDGKGELVDSMKLSLSDYRDPNALKAMTDGALFYVLKKGCDQMPGEEGRMKENQMWNLVNYIRSLARKETAEQ